MSPPTSLAWAGWIWNPRDVREALRPLDPVIAVVIVALIVVAMVALLRCGELWRAHRNTAALLAEGGVEIGRGHYPLIVALHAAYHFWERPGYGSAALFGLAMALAALTRGEALILLGVMILPAAIRVGQVFGHQ